MLLTKIYFLLFFALPEPATVCLETIQLPLQQIVITNSRAVKKRRVKIRWKRIFRPIKIFKKKLSYWLVRCLGLFVVLGIFGYAIQESTKEDFDFDTDAENALAYTMIGIFFLSGIAVIVGLISAPFVYLIRFFKELKWRKRFKQCFKF